MPSSISLDLEQFFELSADLLCITDGQGCLKRVNLAFERQLGYAREELIEHSLQTLIDPADWPLCQKHLNELSADQTVTRFQGRVLCQDGSQRWLEWSVTAHWQTVNGPFYYCIARDITLTKQLEGEIQDLNERLSEHILQRTDQLEQALQKSHLYADTIQNMPLGLYIWELEQSGQAINPTPSFRLVATNPAASQLTGIPAENILNRLMAESFPYLIGSPIVETFLEVLRTGQAQSLDEVTAQYPQAEGRTFAVKVFPLPNQCVGVTFENITQRKYQEALLQDQKAQLQDQKAQLRILFEEIAVGMAQLDLQGRWIQINQSLANLLGYTREALCQLSYQDVTCPEDLEIDLNYHQQLLEGTLDHLSFEKRYLHKAGHPIWTQVTVSVVKDDRQQPLYFIAVIEDISERKQTELDLKAQRDELTKINLVLTKTMRDLERRNEDLDQFAYVASHDLKAPLRAIGNLASWLEEDLSGTLPTENQYQLQLMQGRVHRMEGLIDGLLEYSRVGRVNQTEEVVDVKHLLQDVIRTLKPPETFIIEIIGDMPMLWTKRIPLFQVFSNLISNAIKHHDQKNGHIRISTSGESEGYYEFSVADDGPGIAPNYHGKIFSIFQTLKARDAFESTGIGLSIVKKILNVEGGTIRVNSIEGEGATFSFTWPASVEP